MKKLLFIVCFMTIFTSTLSFYFSISAAPYCFQIQKHYGRQIKFSYQITGDQPVYAIIEVIRNDQIIDAIYGAENKATIDGNYQNKLCITSTDGVKRTIAVHFYTHDQAHIIQLAKKSQIYQLHNKVIQVGESIKQIAKNQQFQQARQTIHSQIIVNHENTLKFFAVGKLLLIIIVAVGQIYLLKRMLDGQGKQGYIPV